jgi:HEAT repeat protein
MRRLIKVLSLAVAIFASAPALAAPDQLLEILSMIDVRPTREQLLEAGSGAHGEVLAEIALDRTRSRYVRTRAASSLSFFDDENAKSALSRVIDGADDAEVRIQAIAAFGVVEGKKAVPRLSVLLADQHPEVRAAAVRALVRTRAPEVGSLLAARLAVDGEEAAMVRALIQRKLAEVAR